MKYLQAVFFNEAGQIVGVTKYDTSLKATEAVADFTKKNGNYVYVDNNAVDFLEPEYSGNLTWKVFII